MSIWRIYDGTGEIIAEGPNVALAVRDNDLSTYISLYNPYFDPFFLYIIEQDFGQTVTITQFSVYRGYGDIYNWGIVEYWSGSSWVSVGTLTNDGWNYFQGSWQTTKWRVRWEGDFEFGIYISINEMSATTEEVPPLLQVSDSGLGSETLSLKDHGLSDTSAGTETAQVASTTFASDYGSGDDPATLITIMDATDSAWGTEDTSLIATLIVDDAGSGVEDIEKSHEFWDSGSGNEILGMVVGMADAGWGLDEVPHRSLGVIDTRGGEEAPMIIIPVKDNSTGREILICVNYIDVGDAGQGKEKTLRVMHAGVLIFLRPQ